MATINDLPDEMLVNIFSYLNKYELVFQVQHVCSKWRKASHDISLWINWCFSPKNTMLEAEIVHFIENCPNLKQLDLTECAMRLETINRIISAMLKNCREVEVFDASITRYNNGKMLRLLHQLSRLKNLSMVVADFCCLIDCTKLLKAISNLPELETLNLTYSRELFLEQAIEGSQEDLHEPEEKERLSNNSIVIEILNHTRNKLTSFTVELFQHDKRMKNIFANCPKLKHLDIVATPFGNHVDWNLLGKLPKLTSLSIPLITSLEEEISLVKLVQNNSMIHLKCFEVKTITSSNILFRDALKECPNLTHLTVIHGVVFMPQHIFDNCPNLKYLNLSNVYLGGNGLQGLHKCARLETLVINKCVIRQTFESCDQLLRCENLKCVEAISNPWLTNTHLKTIMKIRNLEELNIRMCHNISADWLLTITHLPENIMRITQSIHISKELWQQLKKRLPHMRLREDWDIGPSFCDCNIEKIPL